MRIITGKQYEERYGYLPEDELPPVRQVGFYQGKQRVSAQVYRLRYTVSTRQHGHWRVADADGNPTKLIISGNTPLAVED